MSFGLRTWSAKGAIELDTDNFTYQVIHNQRYQLSRGAVITVPIAGFDPAKCSASILPINPAASADNWEAMPYMSVGAGFVSIRSLHPNEDPKYGYGSTIAFRLLAMRYRN